MFIADVPRVGCVLLLVDGVLVHHIALTSR